MSAKNTYTYRIGPGHIDFRRKVSLAFFTDFILNTAGKNATENGFGLLELQSNNYTWVLSRLVVDMHRFPQENDAVSIETWIQDVGKAFTTRNFRVTDGAGEVIGYASSSWAVIDMETRQGLLLDTLPSLQRFVVGDTTPIGIPTRIPNVHGEVTNTFRVKYSDIDINRHANSLHYIQWISDCFSLDFYAQHAIRRFEINFLKELTFEDDGEVQMEMKSAGDYYFQIVTREKGIACRARLVFEEATDSYL